jgi:hypothetical protein
VGKAVQGTRGGGAKWQVTEGIDCGRGLLH